MTDTSYINYIRRPPSGNEGRKNMNIALESWRYRTLAALIADRSYDDGICISLDVTSALADNSMIATDSVTGDHYVTIIDLQEIANIYCASLDVINY